jgi:hypothetical protein
MRSDAPLSEADYSTGSETKDRVPFDTSVSGREGCIDEPREARS